MNVKSFIQGLLIEEIKSIQQKEGHHYLSFGLIAQGIEFLGACLDSNEFFVERKSNQRFNRAIMELFPSKYHKYVNDKKGQRFDLYENLRCGLLHIILPKADIDDLSPEKDTSQNVSMVVWMRPERG